MNTALIFNVPDSSSVIKSRCLQAIRQLGAPLKSDSGHFVTGVVTSGHNSIEVRITWLEYQTGSQITISASHDDITEEELENVALRFRNEYLNNSAVQRKSYSTPPVGNYMMFAGAVAIIAFIIFAVLKHKI